MLETPRAREAGSSQRPPRRDEGSLFGTQPRHLAAGRDPREELLAAKRTSPTRRHGWHWLLAIPGIMPLLVPLYNRVDPKLAGIPFFYWYQMATALVAIVVMTFLYQVTKDKK